MRTPIGVALCFSLITGLPACAADLYAEAIAAYQKSLAINPNNWNAGFARKSIAKMESELRAKKP